MQGRLQSPSGAPLRPSRLPGQTLSAQLSMQEGARGPVPRYRLIRVPSTSRNFASQAEWAGQAGAVTRWPST